MGELPKEIENAKPPSQRGRCSNRTARFRRRCFPSDLRHLRIRPGGVEARGTTEGTLEAETVQCSRSLGRLVFPDKSWLFREALPERQVDRHQGSESPATNEVRCLAAADDALGKSKVRGQQSQLWAASSRARAEQRPGLT